MLLGVERGDWRARPEAALKLGRKLASAARSPIGSFHPRGVRLQSKCANNRAHARERTRLRSAKLLDGAYRFVCEGRICDRSRNGLRLALAQDVPLPPQLAVHIDETSEVREAKVIWRRGSTIGIRLHSAAPARRADGKPEARAERALLRDSGLSPVTHSSSPRPRPSSRAC